MANIDISPGPEPKPDPAASANLRYLGLVPVAIVVAGLYFGRPVLLPLAIAVILAFALAPLVRGLRHLRIGRVASVLMSAIFAISLLISIGAFVGSQVVQLADQLPLYQTNLEQKIDAIRGTTLDGGSIARLSSSLKNLRDHITGGPETRPGAPTPGPALSPRRSLTPTGPEPVPVEVREPEPKPFEVFLLIVRPLIGPLVDAGIVLVFVIFILLHKEDIRDRFISLAGSRDMQRTSLLLDDGAGRLSRYLLTQTVINAGLGVWVAGGLWLIGLPSAVLWGVSVAVLRFVPYIGVPLAAIPALAMALSVDPGWSLFLWTLAFFAASEILLSQAIEPWLYGQKVGLSPVAVIVAATFWTWLWGPAGLLLSTPFTMCLVVLGRHVEHLQFLDVLLGNRPALAVDEALYLRLLGDDADEAALEAESFLKENSLCSYYDDVVLKGLALAQADVSRGVLDHTRVRKVREATSALIDNLSDSASASRGGEARDAETPASEADKPVLCVGGRGALDEAAAMLLVSLLEESGVGARLVSSSETAVGRIEQLDIRGAKVAVLCYLEPGNFARAKYLLRRLRRRIPAAIPLAAFWGYDGGKTEAAEIMGCEIVTGLDEAVQKIVSSLPAGPKPRTRSAHSGAERKAGSMSGPAGSHKPAPVNS
jgi:predicted PurR-regulated permease PerM